MNARILLIASGLVLVGIGVSSWAGTGQQRRIVRELSPTERRAVFDHTLASYRAMCGDKHKRRLSGLLRNAERVSEAVRRVRFGLHAAGES